MLEFLKLLCDPKGYGYKEIAAIMKCSPHTLRTYRDRITKRYRLMGKGAFIAWAFANGWREGSAASGRRVSAIRRKTRRRFAGPISLDVADLAPGCYAVTVVDKGQRSTTRTLLKG